ncbi:MAG: hypothetical protein OXH69_01630 [Acidobacteria bacterium]|nr:hypothetical protein [Acidobacteriota bacterium]
MRRIDMTALTVILALFAPTIGDAQEAPEVQDLRPVEAGGDVRAVDIMASAERAAVRMGLQPSSGQQRSGRRRAYLLSFGIPLIGGALWGLADREEGEEVKFAVGLLVAGGVLSLAAAFERDHGVPWPRDTVVFPTRRGGVVLRRVEF